MVLILNNMFENSKAKIDALVQLMSMRLFFSIMFKLKTYKLYYFLLVDEESKAIVCIRGATLCEQSSYIVGTFLILEMAIRSIVTACSIVGKSILIQEIELVSIRHYTLRSHILVEVEHEVLAISNTIVWTKEIVERLIKSILRRIL